MVWDKYGIRNNNLIRVTKKVYKKQKWTVYLLFVWNCKNNKRRVGRQKPDDCNSINSVILLWIVLEFLFVGKVWTIKQP